MTEYEAFQVVMVKSFETQGTQDLLLSDAERHQATRTAIETIGPRGTPDAFVAARAQALISSVARQVPVVNGMLGREGWHTTWLLLAVGIGLLVGLTADVFSSGTQLNLLAPPAWIVILWNLVAYVVLCARLFGDGAGTATARSGWMARGASQLMDFRFKRLHKLAGASTPQSRALSDFGVAWTSASVPLTASRLATLLHAASAAVAVALIAGMYLRGLVFDYRVEWGSTFLSAESVHALLSFLLAPALWLSGMQLPDVTHMEALRAASDAGRTTATAAPWIHLYAVMLFITVVLPRTLLACWNGWRAQRRSQHFALSLDEPYYRGLLRTQRGDATYIELLPYAQALDNSSEQNLRRILQLAFDNGPQIALAATTPQGGEDDLNGLSSNIAQATHLVVLFDMTATPETEYHGAFLRALAAHVPVLIVVNESGFASRFRAYPQRLAERREAWKTFFQSIHNTPLFFDLASPQMATYVSELRSSLDKLTAP